MPGDSDESVSLLRRSVGRCGGGNFSAGNSGAFSSRGGATWTGGGGAAKPSENFVRGGGNGGGRSAWMAFAAETGISTRTGGSNGGATRGGAFASGKESSGASLSKK